MTGFLRDRYKNQIKRRIQEDKREEAFVSSGKRTRGKINFYLSGTSLGVSEGPKGGLEVMAPSAQSSNVCL